MVRYDSIEYIKDFKKNKQYPKIHDKIYNLHKLVNCKNILDLGCSTGLLTHRLAQTYNTVIGIDNDEKALKHTISKDNIHYYNLTINQNNLSYIDNIIKKYKIDTVFARRVLPELYNNGGELLLKNLINIFNNDKIENIIIEGRFCNNRSIHKLKSIENEIELFKEYYEIIYNENNCAILKRKE